MTEVRRRRARGDNGPTVASPAGIEPALGRLRRLDFSGASAGFERWVRSLPRASGRACLLFDALCRAERTVAMARPDVDLGEDERRRLAGALQSAEAEGRDQAVFLEAIGRLLSAARTRRSSALERARAFVAGNYTRKLALREVASAAGVSPNYLCHLFRKERDETFTLHVNRLRIRDAADLLRFGSKSISEIAYLVGYQNYRDFHRNFVRVEGLSPRRFRASARALRESTPHGDA